MSSRRWADQRGVTLVELLVAAVVGAVVLLGLGALYGATTTAFNQSSSRAYLQRQGTLALQEIARQVQRSCRPGNPLDPLCVQVVTCPAGALGVTVDVVTPIVTYCYYTAANLVGDTTLMEQTNPFGGTTTTQDLLWPYGFNPAGVPSGLIRQTGKKGVYLLSFSFSPPISGSPPTGNYNVATVTLTITDGLDSMSFTTSLKQRNS